MALTCHDCGRPTWAGCGAHVDAVLGHVPVEERCHCEDDRQVASSSSR